MDVCPSLAANIDFSNYYKTTSFTCATGYSRVYYRCIPNATVEKSKTNFLNYRCFVFQS